MTLPVVTPISHDDTRKIVDGETGTTSAPGATDDGFSVKGDEHLHLLVRVVGGTGTDVELYATMDFVDDSGRVWGLFDDFGTSGVESFVAGDTVYIVVPLKGVDRVAVALPTNDGTVDVWAGSNSFD